MTIQIPPAIRIPIPPVIRINPGRITCSAKIPCAAKGGHRGMGFPCDTGGPVRTNFQNPTLNGRSGDPIEGQSDPQFLERTGISTWQWQRLWLRQLSGAAAMADVMVVVRAMATPAAAAMAVAARTCGGNCGGGCGIGNGGMPVLGYVRVSLQIQCVLGKLRTVRRSASICRTARPRAQRKLRPAWWW